MKSKLMHCFLKLTLKIRIMLTQKVPLCSMGLAVAEVSSKHNFVSCFSDGAITPSPSPLPDPARSYAAERLANIRKRKRKNRQDLALEITHAADRRVQAATDRILAALGEYTKADLEERERDRVDTEQIIALMNRQTELLESLVRKQAEAQAPPAPALTRQARLPRHGQPGHAADASPLRLGSTRRSMARARYRR